MPHLPENPILLFLIHNGYWFAVPVMIVEGPIAQIVMGFLASFGYFNPFVVFLFGFFSDVISDTIYYSLGYFNLARFIARFGKYFKLSDKTFGIVKDFYDRHGGKSIFLAKILTGIVPPIFIIAGYSRMNLKKFYFYLSLGGILWSAGLVALGYFFGAQFEGKFTNLGLLLSRTGLVMVSLLSFFILYRFFLHKRVERKLRIVFDNIRSGVNGNDKKI